MLDFVLGENTTFLQNMTLQFLKNISPVLVQTSGFLMILFQSLVSLHHKNLSLILSPQLNYN